MLFTICTWRLADTACWPETSSVLRAHVPHYTGARHRHLHMHSILKHTLYVCTHTKPVKSHAQPYDQCFVLFFYGSSRITIVLHLTSSCGPNLPGNPSGCVCPCMSVFQCVSLSLLGRVVSQLPWTDGPPAGNNDPRQTLKLIMPLWGHRYKVSAPLWVRQRERVWKGNTTDHIMYLRM